MHVFFTRKESVAHTFARACHVQLELCCDVRALHPRSATQAYTFVGDLAPGIKQLYDHNNTGEQELVIDNSGGAVPLWVLQRFYMVRVHAGGAVRTCSWSFVTHDGLWGVAFLCVLRVVYAQNTSMYDRSWMLENLFSVYRVSEDDGSLTSIPVMPEDARNDLSMAVEAPFLR